jgi:hypothetical protein
VDEGPEAATGPAGSALDAGVEGSETSTHIPPRFQFPDGLGAAEVEFCQATSTTLWAVVQVLFEERQVDAPELTVVVTDDIEGIRIGIGPDRRSGVKRAGGGTVAAKTLISDDGTTAIVLLHRNLPASGDGYARLLAATAVAHEFSHALYGIIRNTTVGITQDTWLPWEAAELLACGAAEEYRCDRLAIMLVEHGMKATATDDHGEPIPLATVVGSQYFTSIATALGAVSPELENTILRYRTHKMTLQEMWNAVVRTTEDVLLLISHAEAHSDLDGLLLDTIEHSGASVFMPIAAPLFEYLRTASLLPEASEWPQDRSTLKRIGREGIMAMWARLGLHPRPQGDAFYLEVTAPAV